jgi:hypothetical protein
MLSAANMCLKMEELREAVQMYEALASEPHLEPDVAAKLYPKLETARARLAAVAGDGADASVVVEPVPVVEDRKAAPVDVGNDAGLL